MSNMCAGRVAIVTGAGRGLGRSHAVELARQGARVVVNDLGTERDGTGSSSAAAEAVVAEITAAGGEAIANGEDVADFDGAGRLIDTAVRHFGRLDVLVNNAGILRDRMLVNMTADEWDAVIRVHLRGTFCPLRHAAAHWRARAKAGEAVDARVINTSSASGIYGNIGQANYGAAKAGIAALTVIAAAELARYGVTVNAIAPDALTRMTEDLPSAAHHRVADGFDPRSPDNVAPLVAWLATDRARSVTGRVFNIRGGHLSVAEGWVAGPTSERDRPWVAAELDDLVPALLARARPNSTMDGLPGVVG